MKKCLLVPILLSVALPAAYAFAADSTNESGGAKVEQYVDDATITTKVKAALMKEKLTSALHISVKTEQGVVTLNGNVNTNDEAQMAVQRASQIGGVKGVKNDLKSKSTSVQ